MQIRIQPNQNHPIPSYKDFSMNVFVNNSAQKTATRENISTFQSKWAKLGTLFSNQTKTKHTN
jgi:hypothetical protein